MKHLFKKMEWRNILFLIAICILIPVIVTTIFSIGKEKPDSEYELMGKNVVINRQGYDVTMDVEKFIPCVLFAQMDMESPKEAIKAQAVIIRTYIVNKLGDKNEISADELGFTYYTYEEMMQKWKNKGVVENSNSITGVISNFFGISSNKYFANKCGELNNIISKTNLQVMRSDGKLILPLYHGISCGVTRDGKETLGDEYSYLVSVKCDSDINEEGYLSVKYYTIEELAEHLEKSNIIVYHNGKEFFADDNNKKMDTDEFLKLVKLQGDKNEYIKIVKICDTNIAGEDFAKSLNIQSTNMKIEKYENGLRITSKGQGHGFGLSMARAKQLADDGLDYKKILKTFYNNTEIN